MSGAAAQLRRLWDTLTAVHPSITDAEMQRQSRMLMTVLLLLVAVLGVIIVTATMSDIQNGTSFAELIFLTPFSAVLVFLGWLNKSGHYRWSARLLVGTSFVMLVLYALVDMSGLVYLTLVTVVAALFLHDREVILVGAMALLLVLGFRLFDQRTDVITLAMPFNFTLIALVLLFAYLNNRRKIEEERRKSLELANEQLRESEAALERRVGMRTRDLELATRVARQMTTILDTRLLLNEIAETTRQAFALYHVSVFIHNDAAGKLVLEAGSGEAGVRMKAMGKAFTLKTDRGVVPEAGRTQKAVLANDVFANPFHLPNPILPETRAELAVPMVISGELVGVLDFQSSEVNHFTPDDVSIFTTLAEQLAIAVDNGRRFEANKAVRDESETLYKLSAEVNAAQTYVELVDALARHLDRVSNYQVALTIFGDFEYTDSAQARVMAVKTPEAAHAAAGDLVFPANIAGTVKPGVMILIEDIYKIEGNPEFRQALASNGIGALLFSPIVLAGRVVGALNLAYNGPHHFSDATCRLARGAADLCASVIERIRGAQALEQARQESESLYRVSQSVNAATTYPQVIDAFAREFGPFDFTVVMSTFENYDLDTASYAEIVALLSAGEMMAVESTGTRQPVYRGFEDPHFIVVETPDQLPAAARPQYEAVGAQALLSATLRISARTIGAITFLSSVPRKFSAFERRMVRGIADLAAAAVERSGLYEEQVKAATDLWIARQETDRFYRVSQRLNAATTYADALNAIGSEFGPLEYGIALSIFEDYDRTTASYVQTVATLSAGETAATPAELNMPLLSTGGDDEMMRMDDMSASALPAAAVFQQIGIQAMLSSNLSLGERVMGLLSFAATEPRAWTEDDERILRTMSDLVAAALERTRLYEEQVKLVDQLREVDNLKSRFLASMSHELRTPLNAILNFTKFVQSGMLGPVNDKQTDALVKTINSGKHLLALINDVLDITKIESGMLNLFVETEVDLMAELETVAATGETLLADKPEVRLVRDFDPQMPTLTGDKRRIRQILLNLVSNACKFTEAGQVTFSAHVHDGQVHIVVSDTGPGIPPDDQELVFEPFKQSKEGLKQGGTGLGLPIARRLVEAHGGKLWMESAPGQGATFYVTLPLSSEALLSAIKVSR